jgi:hypothetical protein
VKSVHFTEFKLLENLPGGQEAQDRSFVVVGFWVTYSPFLHMRMFAHLMLAVAVGAATMYSFSPHTASALTHQFWLFVEE